MLDFPLRLCLSLLLGSDILIPEVLALLDDTIIDNYALDSFSRLSASDKVFELSKMLILYEGFKLQRTVPHYCNSVYLYRGLTVRDLQMFSQDGNDLSFVM